MVYIIFILRVLLLFISFLGYIIFINDKLKLNIAFIPIIVLSFVSISTYIGGLLNILELSIELINIIGLILFTLYTLKFLIRIYNIKFLIHPSIIFFILLSGYFFVLLKGMSYLHYDNFSHWATIVKEMFYYNSLPDARTIITFRNYPPGTAVFIYYVCKFIGYSESHALMAQSLIISACFSTLFCKAKFKNISYCCWIIIISIISICILSYDDTTLNIYNLLVDGILGFLTMAAIISVDYYKQDIKNMCISTLPILCLIVLAKDSGKVFFGLIIAYIIFEVFKKLKLSNFFYILILIGIPIFLDILWKIYCKYAYPSISYGSNKFSVSPQSLSDAISDRNQDFIKELPMKLLKEVFNINSLNTQLFMILNILSIITIIFLAIKGKNIKILSRNFILTNLMTAIYIFTLYILYSMIMDENEASSLSAFDRYYSTMIIVLVSIQLWGILNSLFENKIKIKNNNNIIIIFIILISFIEKENLYKIYIRPKEQEYRRYKIQQVCKEARNYIERGQKILLYNGSKGSQGYCSYVISYEMLTNERKIINDYDFNNNQEDTLNHIENYDYLLISEDSNEFWNKIKLFNNIYAENKKGSIYIMEKYNKYVNLICLNK